MTNTDFQTKQISSVKAFNCTIERYEHTSPILGNRPAKFSVILPPETSTPPRPLYWLSGLTCTDENFIIKAGAARPAAEYNVAIICPDTSPRGAGAPNEDDSYDFGTGAGFYVNATTEGYSAYRMHDYVVNELPAVISDAFGARIDAAKQSIFGHSMGGMGALTAALRHESLYASVSAFAPIANPVNVPWGKKCFTGYLGDVEDNWKEYDPTELMKMRKEPLFEDILIEQGDKDGFLENQLIPMEFVKACESVGQKVTLNMAEGYDHSYFFIQTFVEKHIAFHAKALFKE